MVHLLSLVVSSKAKNSRATAIRAKAPDAVKAVWRLRWARRPVR